ncbi:hypothetical protein [Salinibacter ruber]|jgi:hypothetical protein|uniref:Uncharacterized protein n=1 Tax=Salinibacter ruber TaxID=146919 RepID=A0A9X2Q701_9BACT|nr:hypothetical protein [Salinibacter ruber]MCS3660075.1 hypothetical protein [Salinibacter ruber]MCS3709760.1 hypothetical protein [Salinibacter ruber]MCS4170412.1 hypothetical protein [Salinibacter ruber]
MIALHPEDKSRIRGTVDQVPATGYVNAGQFPRRAEDGSLNLRGALAGESEVHWDGQRTVTDDGERLLISEKGNRCRESEVILVPDAYDVRVERDGAPVARRRVPSIDGGSPLRPREALQWALSRGGWTLPESDGQATALPDKTEGLTFKVIERDESGDKMALKRLGCDLDVE